MSIVVSTALLLLLLCAANLSTASDQRSFPVTLHDVCLSSRLELQNLTHAQLVEHTYPQAVSHSAGPASQQASPFTFVKAEDGSAMHVGLCNIREDGN